MAIINNQKKLENMKNILFPRKHIRVELKNEENSSFLLRSVEVYSSGCITISFEKSTNQLIIHASACFKHFNEVELNINETK